MLSEDGSRAVLIDFGVSKHYDENDNQTTSTPIGRSKGYAPIEQYNSGSLNTFSPATDIYSLGATMFYLITGENPPEASIVSENGKITLPSYVSRRMAKVIEKAMKPRKKDRYQSVEEFRKAAGIKPERPLTNPPDEETNIIFKTPATTQKEGRANNSGQGKWDWYMWLFFPVSYSLTIQGDKRKKSLFSLLCHPLTIELLVLIGCGLTGESMQTKHLHDTLMSASVVIFSILSIMGFVGGVLCPFRTKGIGGLEIPKWYRWSIFSMSILSLGFSFDVICLCAYLLSPLIWGIGRIFRKLDLKLNDRFLRFALLAFSFALSLAVLSIFMFIFVFGGDS